MKCGGFWAPWTDVLAVDADDCDLSRAIKHSSSVQKQEWERAASCLSKLYSVSWDVTVLQQQELLQEGDCLLSNTEQVF